MRGPESRGRMRDWWHNPTQVSPSLRLQARDAYIPANTDITLFNTEAIRTNPDLLSTPVQGSTVPDNPVFFLSEVEIHQRLGHTTAADRITIPIDANGNVGGVSNYWFRSIAATTSRVAMVNHGGTWGWNPANITDPTRAFRPTIWVRR